MTMTQTANETTKRERGRGSLYQMKGSAKWWMKYYRGGKAVRESTGTEDRGEAEKKLKTALAQVLTNTDIDPKIKRVRVSELAEDLIREYRINGRKSIDDLEERWKLHLSPFFGVLRAIQVNTPLIARYVDMRQQESAANATINRELAALKRAFNLAQQSTPPKVGMVPHFAMLQENNVRVGFLEPHQYDKLAAECGKIGLWLRTAFELAHVSGWRHGEVLKLRVFQVSLSAGKIRLEPGSTKNKAARELPLNTCPLLRTLIAQCIQDKPADDFVFTRDNGKPVRDFRKMWANVCEAAGVPGLLFHDLRRTMARNHIRAGTPEAVIMKIGGWKTRSVFLRYVIVNDADISDAMTRLETHKQAEARAAQEQLAQEQLQRLTALPAGRAEFGQSDTKTSDIQAPTQIPASLLN